MEDKGIWKISILVFLIILPQYSMSNINGSVLNEKTVMKVWNMVKAFGEKNKIHKNYIFYFQNLEWAKAMRKFIKGRISNDGLFGFDVKRSETIEYIPNSWFSSSRITLHVSDHFSLPSLDDQIREGNNSTFNGMKNYFLINVPSDIAKDTENIKQMFQDSPLSFNSLTFAFFITNQTHDNGEAYQTIEIYDVYKINASSKEVELTKYGTWSEERAGYGEPGESLLLEDEAIWKRRGNLKGYHIRAAGAYYPNFCTGITDNCTEPDCFTGISGNVWNTLAESLNFTYTIRETNAWGSQENNSGIITWTGMIGMLIDDEIDIAAADFTVTSDRSAVVDFLPVLIESFIQVFVANPEGRRNWMAFVEPVTWEAWLGILAFLVLSPPLMCCIIFYGNEKIRNEFRLSDCYCFAYKTLLMQGWSQTPGSYQNRIVFVFVMIAGMLLYWHWEAMVISYLAVRKIVLPYTSFEQLLSSSSDKVVTKQGTVYGDLFRYSQEDSTLSKVWKERMESEFESYPTTDDEMIEKVLGGGYAAFDSSSGWMTRAPYLQCKVISLPIAYAEQLTYAMQKNSPFYWLFHYNINKMKEGGTFQQIVNTFSGESQVCEDQSGEPLDMNQCLSAFIFLVAGGGLGLLFLLMERFLPNKWMNSLLTFGDQSFERCLTLVYKDDRTDSEEMSSDEDIFYDTNSDLKGRNNFYQSMDEMSRQELIEELKHHSQQKAHLMKRIEELESLIVGDPSMNGGHGKWAQSVKWDKQVRSKQFDEAFDITMNSEKMGKTYSRASSTQTLLSEKQSKHFPEHAFSLSE